MYKKTVTTKKAKVTTHVCSGCIKDFDAKFLFVGQMVDYTTLFCQKCIDELKIEIVRPYHKVREKVVKEKVVKDKEKTTTKTKKSTTSKVVKDAMNKVGKEKITPKTKKSTTSKTKKSTKTTKRILNDHKTNEEEKYD